MLQRDLEVYHELGETLARVSLALDGFDAQELHREWDWALPCLGATHARIRPTLLTVLPTPDM
jgi:Ser/Thr protein kinase RdoA (MazF antagonist)